MHFAVFSVQFTVCNVQFTVCNVPCAVCSVKLPVCSVQSELCSALCAVFRLRYPVKYAVCDMQVGSFSVLNTIVSVHNIFLAMQRSRGVKGDAGNTILNT